MHTKGGIYMANSMATRPDIDYLASIKEGFMAVVTSPLFGGAILGFSGACLAYRLVIQPEHKKQMDQMQEQVRELQQTISEGHLQMQITIHQQLQAMNAKIQKFQQGSSNLISSINDHLDH